MASRVQTAGSRFQTVIVIVVFAGIIGGLTFVRQWLSPPVPPPAPTPTKSDGTGPRKSHLTFLLPEEGPEMEPVEFETRPARGHHDFWFRNDNDEPVQTGIDYLSCSQCVSVKARLLTEEQSQKFLHWLPKAGALSLAGIPAGPFTLAGIGSAAYQETADFLLEDDSWNYLTGETEVQTLTVPPKTAGLVRLMWERSKVGIERAQADLRTEIPGKNEARGSIKLLHPIMFVAPIIVYPTKGQVDLAPGEHKTLDFYCWSDTNAGFQIQAQEKDSQSPSHPCFSCSWVPLTPQELQQMSGTLRGQTHPTALFGYHVLVTVFERLPNGAQLDLGDFNREIILTSPDLEFSPGSNNFSLAIKGKVQGDLAVGLGDDRDKVDLGMYQASRGTTKEIKLKSPRRDLQLKQISHKPAFLQVKLEELGKAAGGLEGKLWKLKVSVPANRAAIPEDAVIILETNDQPPRKVRIPVTGLTVWSGRPRS